jgi:hypothetical protein
MTEVHHLKKAKERLTKCKHYTFCRERYGQLFLDSQGIFFINFLIKKLIVMAAYQVKPAFRSKQ